MSIVEYLDCLDCRDNEILRIWDICEACGLKSYECSWFHHLEVCPVNQQKGRDGTFHCKRCHCDIRSDPIAHYNDCFLKKKV